MIVLDASAVVEVLRGTDAGGDVQRLTDADQEGAHIPYLCAVEVANVFRALVARGFVSPDRASGALQDLRVFPALRWPAEPLLPRIWQLRDNLTAYDAHYVALAEALGATLITRDMRLARTAPPGLDVHLVR